MIRRLKVAAGVAALALTIAACVNIGGQTPPPRLFVLQPAVEADPPPLPTDRPYRTLAVGPVDLPDYLDRNQLVTRKAAGELAFSPGARWAEPLQAGIRRTLAANLERTLAGFRVVPDLPPVGSAAAELQLRLERFEGGPGATARLEGEWQLLRPGGQAPLRGIFAMQRPWSGDEEGLVRVLDVLLADLARELVPSLRRVLDDPQAGAAAGS